MLRALLYLQRDGTFVMLKVGYKEDKVTCPRIVQRTC